MIVTNSVSDHEIVVQNEKLQGALSKSSEVQNPADSQSQARRPLKYGGKGG